MKEVAYISLSLFFLHLFLGLLLFVFTIIKRQHHIHYLTSTYILRAILFLSPALMIYSINIEWSVWTTGPIKVVLLPLTYLFIKKLFLADKKLSKQDLLHFIPFFFNLVFTSIIAHYHIHDIVRDSPNPEDIFGFTWENNFYFTLLATTARSISLAQGIVYSLLFYPLIKCVIKFCKQEYSTINTAFFKWLYGIFLLFAIIGILDGAAIFGIYQYLGCFILWFCFLLINAFFFFLFVVVYSEYSLKFIPLQTDNEKAFVTSNNWLQIFVEKELFLQPTFSLQSFSTLLDVPKNKLSQEIKNAGYENFYHFVNYYRIQKSKELLLELPDEYVIESVVNDSGFNSRSTFFRVFKEYEGMTPGAYIKGIQSNR
ncbi:AraC family transcriptional regulator [Prolixibacteraceae bacterium JC049]|nr:AraC family transcriptional regulator [Prolixibacteraceae bacterium JC049]